MSIGLGGQSCVRGKGEHWRSSGDGLCCRFQTVAEVSTGVRPVTAPATGLERLTVLSNAVTYHATQCTFQFFECNVAIHTCFSKHV